MARHGRRAHRLLLASLLGGAEATRLHDAAVADSMAQVREYLDAGDAIDEIDEATGDTPLLAAVRHNSLRALHLLLKRGASQRIGDREDGLYPLHVAAHFGHAAAAEKLIAYGFPVSDYHTDGFTPLHRAAKGLHAAHMETMRVLVRLGAAPDEPTMQPYDLAHRHQKPIDLVVRADGRAALQEFLAEPWRRPSYGLSPFWGYRVATADSALEEDASGDAGSGSGDAGSGFYGDVEPSSGSGSGDAEAEAQADAGSGSGVADG